MSDIGNWLQECTTIKFEQRFFINPFVRNLYKTIADTPCVLEIISNSTDNFKAFLIAVNSEYTCSIAKFHTTIQCCLIIS